MRFNEMKYYRVSANTVSIICVHFSQIIENIQRNFCPFLPMVTSGYHSSPLVTFIGLNVPYWTLIGINGPYFALLGLTRLYLVLIGLTKPLWALLGLTGPYWASLGLTGPYWALLGLNLHLSNGLTNIVHLDLLVYFPIQKVLTE